MKSGTGAGAVPSTMRADVVVVGPGAAGLTLALALARGGISCCLIGRADTRANARTVALLESSVEFYRGLGLWEGLEPLGAPLRSIRLIDDTGALLHPPPVTFAASEIGLPAFGYNIENATLIGALAATAQETPGLVWLDAPAIDFRFGRDRASVYLEDGRSVETSLVVAADGRNSPARRAAGITARERPYPQVALTAFLAHRRPHGAVSTEFHTRGGPFTLVPLCGTERTPHRSSLVWLMPPAVAEQRARLPDEKLGAIVERQARSFLGAMRLEAPRGLFPILAMRAERLTGPRVALVGEAAHVLAPIGAQGLNLGLRDVADLVKLVAAARRGHDDPGGAPLLARYESMRRADVTLCMGEVDALNRSLLGGAVFDLPRAAGLIGASLVGPARRLLMRRGIGRRAVL